MFPGRGWNFGGFYKTQLGDSLMTTVAALTNVRVVVERIKRTLSAQLRIDKLKMSQSFY